jgi:hypothetical protein
MTRTILGVGTADFFKSLRVWAEPIKKVAFAAKKATKNTLCRIFTVKRVIFLLM